MAYPTVSAPYGLKPINLIGGQVFAGATRQIVIANTTGTWVDPANGVYVDASGVGVLANNGIVANSSGTWAKAANGISVDSSGINVVGGTGVHVNATSVYIGQAVETTSNVTFANVVRYDVVIVAPASGGVL